MRFYVHLLHPVSGVQMLGSDNGACLPRSVKTERGAVRWAHRWLDMPGRRSRIAELEAYSDARPYGDVIKAIVLHHPSLAAEIRAEVKP